MAINVGDKIPTVDLSIMTADGPEGISTDDIFGGKKVAIFGLPGAFTPTCSAKHLPGFVNNAEALKAKGINAIVCLAVNDVFVMGAWGKDQTAGNHVMLVADGRAVFGDQESDLTGTDTVLPGAGPVHGQGPHEKALAILAATQIQ